MGWGRVSYIYKKISMYLWIITLAWILFFGTFLHLLTIGYSTFSSQLALKSYGGFYISYLSFILIAFLTAVCIHVIYQLIDFIRLPEDKKVYSTQVLVYSSIGIFANFIFPGITVWLRDEMPGVIGISLFVIYFFMLLTLFSLLCKEIEKLLAKK
jgi:hypothetical protein